MKTKALLALLITGTLILFLGMLVYYSHTDSLDKKELFRFGVLLLVAVFAIFIGVRRFRSEKKGQPAEDELSKRIMQKAGATAFYISLYFWLALSYVCSSKNIDTESAIGTGIIGMSVIFALSWIYHRTKGIKDS